MVTTIFHRVYAGLKKILPGFVHRPLRSMATAILTPIRFSIKKGHFKSSLLVKAVDRHGAPIPWYTYPCVDFLSCRSFEGLNVLEFGAGQSTLWWSQKAAHVVSFEGNKEWYNYLTAKIPTNVTLRFARDENAKVCIEDVIKGLSQIPVSQFDIVIIDGLWRYELIEVAKERLKQNGAIICDNSEGYGFFEGFAKDDTFSKVDFYGYAPGCILQSCTTIYFKINCPMFDTTVPTYDAEKL